MSEGEFPLRNFTVRSDGYDRGEVDGVVDELQQEIRELRRALDTATTAEVGDVRLHDPEGAVTRTLAIAQETADRVLHDAQVEADRMRAEADDVATGRIADAEEQAGRMLAEIETQTAEIRAQGIAAARAAIQVERDKAIAELGEIRRVRDDIRAEAVDLKSVLERHRSQAREASDLLASAASGPLLTHDLPDFVADDVVLAGVVEESELGTAGVFEGAIDSDEIDPDVDTADLEPVAPTWADGDADDDDAEEAARPLAAVADLDDDGDADELADVIAFEGEGLDGEDADDSGAFLAEVRAASDGDDDGGDDRFLSELRDVADNGGDDEAVDLFFDED